MILSQPISNFVGGISQQPDDLRLPNQVDDAINVEFSPTEGATKRPPLNHVGRLATSELVGYSLIPLDRDDTLYLIAVGPGDIKVLTAAGTVVPVRTTTNTGGGFAPVFTYLNGITRDTLRHQPIVDTVFLCNNNTVVQETTGRTFPAFQQAGEAGVFIRQVGFSIDYTVRFKTVAMGSAAEVTYRTDSARAYDAPGGAFPTVTVTSNGQTVFTVPATVLPFNSVSDLSFEAISGTGVVGESSFREIKDSETQILYTGPAWTAGDTFRMGRTGSVTRSHRIRANYVARRLREAIAALSIAGLSIEGGPDDTAFRLHSTSPFELFEVKDSVANTFAVGFTDSVDSLASLPTVWKDGYTIRVAGGTPSQSDDFYARFTVNEGAVESFGEGRWSEDALPITGKGALVATTMPHTLTLSRDDGSGTFTGTANALFFDFKPFTWDIRRAGDAESNKAPSFIGQKIQDIFWWANRFGVLSGFSVVMSETGEQGNFWRTTVLAVPDSDRIDIASTEDEGSSLLAAVPLDTRLFVFSAQSQLVLTGQPLISPRTVEAPVVSKFLTESRVQPILVSRSVYFASPSAQFVGIRQLVPGQDALQFGDVDITAATPRLLTRGSGRLVGNSNKLVYHTTADPRTLFVYHYLDAGGEILLASWGKYLTSRDILDVAMVDDAMYILTSHAGETYLERMDLGAGLVDSGTSTIVHLDRRVRRSQLNTNLIAYDVGDDLTFFTLPFKVEDGDDIRVVLKAGLGDLQIEDVDHVNSQVVVRGEYKLDDLWIGVSYPYRLRLARPIVSNPTGRGRIPIHDGTTLIQRLTLSADNTGYLQARVQYLGSPEFTFKFTGSVLGVLGAGLEDGDLQNPTGFSRDGRLEVLIGSRPNNFVVDVENPTHLSSRLIGGTWTIKHNRKSRLT